MSSSDQNEARPVFTPSGQRTTSADGSPSGGFLTEGRTEFVDLLAEVWAGVCCSGRPRLVSLEARSGFGKTRVVQHFFEQIAAGQSFYAPSLVPQDRTEVWDARRLRKFVRAPVAGAPRGEPEFFWFALDCDMTATGTESGTSRLLPEIRKVAPEAFTEREGWGETRSTVRDTAMAAAETAAHVATFNAVGVAKHLYRVGRSEWLSRRAKRDKIDKPIEEMGGVLAWSALAAAHVVTRRPMVLVVEDSHLADDDLCDLLNLLFEPGRVSRRLDPKFVLGEESVCRCLDRASTRPSCVSVPSGRWRSLAGRSRRSRGT